MLSSAGISTWRYDGCRQSLMSAGDGTGERSDQEFKAAQHVRAPRQNAMSASEGVV